MKNARENGFTLMELLVVVAIILTLGIFSTSFYARFYTQNAVENTAQQLVGELRKAQIYSMMGKQNGGVWGVDYSNNTITLFQGNTYATRNSALDEKFSTNANIVLSGLTDVTFAHATGLPSTTATVTITGNNTTKTLTINAGGIVSR